MSEMNEIVDFLEYLKNKKQEISDELNSYYELLEGRGKSHMNTYGIATPAQRVLLNKYSSLKSLETKLKNGIQNLDEIKTVLGEELNNCQDNSLKDALQYQLQIIDEYKINLGQRYK